VGNYNNEICWKEIVLVRSDNNNYAEKTWEIRGTDGFL
jgi:hypothetical protein